MKNKKIKKVIAEKINEWLESITDEGLRDRLKKDIIVTGGSIVSLMSHEPVNDYDIYFKSRQSVIDVAEYYAKESRDKDIFNCHVLTKEDELVKLVLGLNLDEMQTKLDKEIESQDTSEMREDETVKNYEASVLEFECFKQLFINAEDKNDLLKSVSWRIIHNIHNTFTQEPDRVKIYGFGSWGAGGKVDEEKIDSQEVEDEEEKKYEVKFISANAITLSDKIQIVVRFFGDADKIHENFDFVHATNYFETFNEKHGRNHLVTYSEALESLIGKHLIYKGSKYPLASIFRARKFIYRGWTIDAGQYLKMVFQLNSMDLFDPYVLEEQLTGVDLVYFTQILNDFTNKKLKDKNFVPSTDYFIKIVERVFE